MVSLLSSLLLFLVHGTVSTLASPAGSLYGGSPMVTVKNGTIKGKYSPEYDQDFFLGVPFAQPPVGDLRFTIPQSANTSWDGVYDATKYSSAVRKLLEILMFDLALTNFTVCWLRCKIHTFHLWLEANGSLVRSMAIFNIRGIWNETLHRYRF